MNTVRTKSRPRIASELSTTVRVVAVEGVMLEVEPEVGGARDHRDRSGRH